MRLLEKSPLRAFDCESAAQALRSAMGEGAFVDALQVRLAHPEPNATIERRLRWLRGIPIRAVLSTNFDGLLSGLTPGREAHVSVLRAQGHRLWDRRYWEGLRPGATKPGVKTQ